MPNFTAGTSFTDGVTNDVTAAKLNALVADAVPTSSLSLNSTTGTIGLFSSGTGTAATPAIQPTGDTNTGIFFPAADTIAFSEGGAEAMRINSSGNVGIGTSSPAHKLQVSGIISSNDTVQTTDGTTVTIMSVAGTGEGIVGTSSNHALQFRTNGSERLRIDSSGNVGIGNTSPATALETASFGKGLAIGSTSDSANNITIVSSTTSTIAALKFGDGGSGVYDQGYLIYDHTNNSMLIGTNRAERLRIDSSGNVLIGATSGQSSERLLTQGSSATGPSFIAYSPSATFTGYVVRILADRNTSDSTYNFLSCTRVASAGDVFIIRDSGNAVNTNNSYGAISDIKLKENIEDAASQWNDIKSIQVRNFSFKNDEEHKRMLGLVAQEVELISPNLVEAVIDRDKDGNDLGTTTKEVKYSVLYMKAVKALQEAMGRIEQLEAKVTALEAA